MITNLKEAKLFPWLVVAALAAVQLQFLPGDYLGRELDDAYYVLAAQGLARGEYRLGISPGNPPITFITPGFPLLLVPVAWLFGESHGAYHLAAWVSLALCDALAWLWLKRRLPRAEALLCVSLFAMCPLTLARAGIPMTEFPALAFALAAFLAIDDGRPAWLVGAIVAYAWLMRQGTLALLPAAWGWYLVRKRWRDAALSALPFCGVAGGVSWWFSRSGSGAHKVDEMRASYGSLADVPRVVAENWSYYSRLWGRLWLPASAAPDWLEAAAGAALLALCAWGGWRIMRRRGWEPAVLWIVFGTGMYSLWPWRYERYLASFLPVLMWMLWEGVRPLFVGNFARYRTSVFALALAFQFWAQGRHILAAQSYRSVPELQETYRWIRQRLPADSAIASLPYSRDALYVNHPVAPLPLAAPPRELARTLRGARIGYVLMQGPLDLGSSMGESFVSSLEVEGLRRSLERKPFRRIYANPAEGSVVYQVPDRG